MTAIGKIDAVYREKTFPVEAVKLYTDVNRHSVNSVGGENPFANTRSLGLCSIRQKDMSGRLTENLRLNIHTKTVSVKKLQEH